MTKAEIKAAQVHENRRVAFAKRVRNLLGHVSRRVPHAGIDARFNALSPAQQVEYGAHADALAAEIAAAEPVGRALHPQKASAVLSARETAKNVIARVYAELDAHGWDLNAVAPYPSSFGSSREDYQRGKSKHNLYSSLTRPSGPASYARKPPHIVVADQESADRFVSHTEQDAALQYDAFICKMVSKVGEVTAAQIAGEHVWGHSILTVVLRDGTSQRWKTQQITNYSVYGRPYLQWPSRKIK